MKTNKQKIMLLTAYAILAALVIVLQSFVSIPLGPYYVTLTLVPIMVGAILYGPACGAFLGAVFGVVVSIQVVTGAAGYYSFEMFRHLPAVTIAICMVKGTMAGLVSGLVYQPFRKKSGGLQLLGTVLSAVSCPIVNTGIFAVGLMAFYGKLVSVWTVENGYATAVAFLFIFMIGVNFLVEFAINVLLIPAVMRIIRAVKKNA